LTDFDKFSRNKRCKYRPEKGVNQRQNPMEGLFG